MKHQKLDTKYLIVYFLSLIFNVASAQTKLRDTDIYLVPMNRTDSGLVLGGARIATPDHDGYDNQPSFSYDTQYMYYSSIRDQDKTDVYTVYLREFKNLSYIETGNLSEFLPQQKPDMTGVSVVRVDDANGTQQLWLYRTDGSNELLTPNFSNVGYYSWFNDTLIGMRLEGKPNVMGLLHLNSNRFDTLLTNIGSSFGKVPSEDAFYYTVNDRGLQRLMRYRYDTRKTDSLLYLPGGATEFSVAVDGSLWAANAGVVYRWKRAAAKWETVTDFGGGALAGAYRVAISRDMRWLAVVTEVK